jgi:hypothetical protein
MKYKTFALRLPPELYNQISALADKDRRSVNQQINYMLEQWLEQWLEQKAEPPAEQAAPPKPNG